MFNIFLLCVCVNFVNFLIAAMLQEYPFKKSPFLKYTGLYYSGKLGEKIGKPYDETE